jgi:hypothetical protein
MRAAVLATGLGVDKRKRESARPAARGPTAKRENGCWFWPRTEQFEAARRDAALTAKTTKSERHDWHLADA